MIRSLLCVCLLIPSLVAAQTDHNWNFWSLSQNSEISFFSSTDLRRLPGGHVEIWTKSLPGKQADAAGTKALKNGEVLKRVVARAMASTPVISTVVKLTKNQLYEIVLDEEIANHSELSPV
jgi:hypothetical protein